MAHGQRVGNPCVKGQSGRDLQAMTLEFGFEGITARENLGKEVMEIMSMSGHSENALQVWLFDSAVSKGWAAK